MSATERPLSASGWQVSDDLLADGILSIARHAHKHLLRRGGRFVPARAHLFVALGSVRVGECSGFDLSAFNAFRSNEQVRMATDSPLVTRDGYRWAFIHYHHR